MEGSEAPGGGLTRIPACPVSLVPSPLWGDEELCVMVCSLP